MTINVTGPDGSNFAFPDGTDAAVISGAMAKHYGAADAPAAPPADPVTLNKVVRATAEGVPLVGGVLNKLNAATNATLAPVVEPLLTPSADDISRPGPSTERIGDIPLPAKPPTWTERYRKSLDMQGKGDESFAKAHPYIDTAAKVTGGVAGSIPMMMAAPAAFGLTGTLPQMVGRGAASNAALGGADAVIRGESPVAPALIGGLVGAGAPLVARGVGKLWSGIQEARNPTAPVRQNVETVAGKDIPLSTGQATADPAAQAEEEIMRRGARGESAEAIARKADEEARKALEEATSGIAASLDPAGASVRTAPQAAGQVVQSELAAQEAAKAAAQAAQVSRVAAEGENLARGLGGGAAPASPFDAAEGVGAAVAARRDAKVAATKEAYRARDEVAGEFDPSVPQGLAEDIRARLNTGPPAERIHVDPVNEGVANRALKIIDQTVGKDSGLFADAVIPKPPQVAAAARDSVGIPAKATEDETVAALRAKFGDSVADAYAKQNQPPPLSLLEFIASKGGLAPHAELDAIGMNHGHRAQIPGQKGFFGTVRKNGADIDRMREAAEEAGYFRSTHEGTSTPREFLDAIDAELRGQKKYPAGFEDFKGKKATTAADTRAAAESDRINAGFEGDLADAGHGGLGPDVKQRAVALMREEGMAADDAVETAFRQLEQEDAASAMRAASDFPGDRPAAVAAPAPAKPVDLRAMDDARKQLVTLYGDAKAKAIASGEKSDLRAMARILEEFDNSIADALAAGKFSGDAKMAKELQDAARASHAEYKRDFSAKPGDEIGRAIEKILGRYSDTAATPEQIMALSYGPKSNPGTGNAVKVAKRLEKILSPEEFGQWKSGLLKYVDDPELSAVKRAARLDNFLNTSLAKGALTAEDRAAIATYSKNIRASEPPAGPLAKVQKDIARIAGTDGHRPATVDEVTKMILADNGDAQRLLVALKPGGSHGLKPESWVQVKQAVFDDLVNAPAGHNAFTALQKSKNLSDYIGSSRAALINTPAELAEMGKLASVYKRMVPLPGTTNPSGSATIGAKILSKAGNNLMTMLGFAHGGVGGAVIGHGADAISRTVKDARAAKEATRLFFGPQAKRAVKTSRVPALVLPSAAAASQR